MKAPKRNFEQLMNLVLSYTGVSQKELADRWSMDPGVFRKSSGDVKLTLLDKIAATLDTSIDTVADLLIGGGEDASSKPLDIDYETADRVAKKAFGNGDYQGMVTYARHAQCVSQTENERAAGLSREAGGWDGLGHFSKAKKCIKQGLELRFVEPTTRQRLIVNLANFLCVLWELREARGIARDSVEWYEESPPQTKDDRVNQAFAHYVLGSAHRRLIMEEPESASHHARRAKSHLCEAMTLHKRLDAESVDEPWYAAIANTCQGALIEVAVQLGEREPGDAADEMWSALPTSESFPQGQMLESHGWWCVFGGNITISHLSGESRDRFLGQFTGMARDIAKKSGNWSLWERTFSLDYLRRRADAQRKERAVEWPLDEEERQVLAGLIAKFPRFRRTGWEIFTTAQFVS